MEFKQCSVAIVGAGVTGTAIAYALATTTSIKDVILIERASEPGTVNSNATNNSQTLHTGDIETNYTIEKALSVQKKAQVLYDYVLSKNDPELGTTCHKMVLGVGMKEVDELVGRFQDLKEHYPELHFLNDVQIGQIEPNVTEGRSGPLVAALSSSNGMMINYKRLSESLLSDAKTANDELQVMFNTTLQSVVKDPDCFLLHTDRGTITARVVVFVCGAYSLHFAHMLGYGKRYTLLPIAGSYFVVKNALKGKVYRVQKKNLPFAAVHGDPEITDPSITRFGPTTKPLPLMERHRYETSRDFFGLYKDNFWKGAMVLLRILLKKRIVGYVLKNMLYDVPIIGKYLFLREVRSIIPTVKYSDIALRKGAGGIRPQLVDLEEMDIPMGDATITGKRCLFNTTPSPGASMCLANGFEYAKTIKNMLSENVKVS